MENGEGKPKSKSEWKNFYVGKNPVTGKPYFERRKVIKTDPNEPPEMPPFEEGLMTKEEHDKFKAGQENGTAPLEPKAYTQGELIPSGDEELEV